MPNQLNELLNAPAGIGYYNNLDFKKPDKYWNKVLFPDATVNTTHLKLIYGGGDNGEGLSLSANDTKSIRLKNEGFESMDINLLLFKNHFYLDEEKVEEIQNILATNPSQAIIDGLTESQLEFSEKLILRAERMRESLAMQALTTGKIEYPELSEKGDLIANHTIEFYLKEQNKFNPSISWADTENATPIDDVVKATDNLATLNDTNLELSLMNRNTFRMLSKTGQIRNTVIASNPYTNVSLPQSAIKETFLDGTNIQIETYDESINGKKLIPDGKVVLVPDGPLGHMYWTPTQEEKRLKAQQGYDVDSTDNGITLTTNFDADPVGTKVMVSERFVPAFESCQNVVIMDVTAGEVKNGKSDELTQAKTDLTNAKRNLTNAQKGDDQDKINEAQTAVDNAQAKVDELSK